MDALIESLAEDPGIIIGLVAVVGMILIGLPAVLLGISANMQNTKERERSRRELAAYVAEGSMSPDDAERLLSAAQPQGIRCRK
jgi:hypothetical protein